MKEININALSEIKIGSFEDIDGGTGCTVFIAEEGVVAGYDLRGSAPATRETDLLDPRNMADKIHAIVLSGGSAYGLEASCGVMKYLEEKGVGFEASGTVVPLVCGASIFDLTIGDSKCRPDKHMGYKAAECAMSSNYKDGSYGVGTGATVGKIHGPNRRMKGGVGSYCVQIGALVVGAVVAVNAFGDVYDENGNFLAGVLDENGQRNLSTSQLLAQSLESTQNDFDGNTTIGTIITNAKLTKAQCSKIAAMGHDGFARTIKPVHTSKDGDCIFAMATGKVEVNNIAMESICADVVEQAVIRAIKSADSLFDVKSWKTFELK